MKLPEPAPDWQQLFLADKGSILELSRRLAPVLKKANHDYLYWDKFKYQPLPPEVAPEYAWAALKLNRVLRGIKTIPLADGTGRTFSYWVPDSAQQALHFLDQNAVGQILVDEPAMHSEEKQRYIVKSIMEEAITSSQLEGAATTRVVAKEMLRSGRKPRDHAERMIFNNYQTISRIREFVDEPLSVELLLNLHRLISQDTLEHSGQEGRFRIREDGDIRVYDERDQVLHTPPPPEDVEAMVGQLCDFANKEEAEEFVHPVIKGIILHFWLAYLHPFADGNGNGRAARALFYWYMLKQKYWLFEYLSISRVMRRAAGQYYRSFLYTETDEGDMTYFIMFHLRAITLAIDELRGYLARKQAESRQAMRFLKRRPNLNHRQRALLMSAIEKPDNVYTFTTHMKTHNVVYQTARADLLALQEAGLLEMQKAGRKYYFTPVVDLQEKIL